MPAEPGADRSNDGAHRVFDACSLGERSRDRVLHRLALLGLHALAEGDDSSDHASGRRVGPSVLAAYYKMATIEHFAHISLVARLLGAENLISREEVGRLEVLRGFYGIAAPAPLCTDPAADNSDQVLCQVLEAPESPRDRLVPDVTATLQRASRDGEIRLTYGELTALIADAVKNLRE
jgi:hypothetical protein